MNNSEAKDGFKNGQYFSTSRKIVVERTQKLFLRRRGGNQGFIFQKTQFTIIILISKILFLLYTYVNSLPMFY